MQVSDWEQVSRPTPHPYIESGLLLLYDETIGAGEAPKTPDTLSAKTPGTPVIIKQSMDP